VRGAIVALGNPLMGDDGAGPAALERLRGMALPPGVALLDAGTAGLGLLHILADEDSVVLVDAVDFGGAPGEIRTFSPSEACSRRPVPLSLHEGDALQVVALAERLGQCPRHVAFCAIQPAQIAPVQALTPAVAAGLPALAEEVMRTLRTMLHGGESS
jgi:hydrogenase maturation protease